MAASQPTPLFGEREALAFFKAAFGQLPERRYLVLWELAGKQSASFTDLEKAAAWAADRNDAYVHVGLADRAYIGGHRVKANEVAGIVGCWADLDIADPVHKKEGLPPSEQAALAVAQATGLEPSILVHSGHGLQAWWLLNEPWMFETPEERRRAATLVRAWDLSLRERARRLGWTLDAVGDLSRLLRIPGTRNCKALPVAVRIEAQNEVRYSVDDLESALVDDVWSSAEREIGGERSSDRPADDGDLVLNQAAEPPYERTFALLENDPQFMATWNRTRRDTRGWSASEFDMSLARTAALAGWERQEIANLLIASRRKHHDDLKLRQDYYANTITRARTGEVEREMVDDAVAMAEEVRQLTPGTALPNRSEMLGRVGAALGVPITRVLKGRGDPSVFRIETPHGGGVLGGIGVIGSNSKFRDKVAEITNRFPRRLKSDKWDPIAQLILESAELEDIGTDATLEGQAETLVSLFLSRHRPESLAEMDRNALADLPLSMPPFIDRDGKTYVFGSRVRSWLIEIKHETMTNQEFGTLMRAYGATAETRKFMANGKRTTRSVWELPDRNAQDETETDSRTAAATTEL